jgi:hypothetical protein
VAEFMGPFSVAAAQIEGLGVSFAPFVQKLLATEASEVGLRGDALSYTSRQNQHDGGVDAEISDAPGNRFIPSGDSAWQFKAGVLSENACKIELEGATHAREVIRRGGAYVLVMGRRVAPPVIALLRDALVSKATELLLPADPEKFHVYSADTLVDWVERWPALAASPILGSIGNAGLDFERWSNAHIHRAAFVPSRSRTEMIGDVHSFLASDGLTLRIEGQSGIGKTRMAIEAFRDHPSQPLVVYFDSAAEFTASIAHQLFSQERSAIVVVDDCDMDQHKVCVSRLQAGSTVRVVTIGTATNGRTRSPPTHGWTAGVRDDARGVEQLAAWPLG